jgi:hypothetical protein
MVDIHPLALGIALHPFTRRSSMSDIDEANANPVDPELMKEMLEFLDTIPAEQRGDVTNRTLELIDYLDQKLGGLETLERAAILISFEIRMEALFRLRRRPEFRAWQSQPGKGADLTLSMIQIAASEPLFQRNERAAFHPVTFFQKALERTQAMGSA